MNDKRTIYNLVVAVKQRKDDEGVKPIVRRFDTVSSKRSFGKAG